SAQALSDGLCIRDFRPDQPERVHKRQPSKFLPLLTKIPELKFTGVLLPKPDRLIADDQTCARYSCLLRNTTGQTRVQSKLGEKATQKVDRSFRCRIKLDFFDLRELSAVRDYYTVNRAVG